MNWNSGDIPILALDTSTLTCGLWIDSPIISPQLTTGQPPNTWLPAGFVMSLSVLPLFWQQTRKDMFATAPRLPLSIPAQHRLGPQRPFAPCTALSYFTAQGHSLSTYDGLGRGGKRMPDGINYFPSPPPLLLTFASFRFRVSPRVAVLLCMSTLLSPAVQFRRLSVPCTAPSPWPPERIRNGPWSQGTCYPVGKQTLYQKYFFPV